MAQTIKLKRSSVSGNTPSTSDLELGEVAINTHDGKMFIKKNDGSDSIVEIGGSSGTVTDAFKTIAVSGQTSVVADSATDTLTFVAGTNMTITTNAGGDTITFASTGSSGSSTFLGLSDSPANFSGAAGKFLKVNSSANSIEFDTLNFDDLGTTPTTIAGYGITDALQLGTSATTALAGNTSIPSALTDLSISDGSSGQVLQTDGSGGFSFVNQTGGNSFGTIAVSGQSNVVADQGSDTLTLVAGSNVTLTTNAGGDSVTIASSGGGGSSAADAIFEEYQFNATGGQTTFTGSDNNSQTLSYTADAIQVFLNGVFLDPAVDYTATNGTSIVLSETVDANDYLQVIAYKKKISDGQTTVDTFSGNGSTTAFTLSLNPGDENNTRVFIDGVYQSKSNYAVSGTTLTFSTAPPNGTAVEVEIGNRVVTLDTTASIDLPDNVQLRLGTDQDMKLYHTGAHGVLTSSTGDIRYQSNTRHVFSDVGFSETHAVFNDNGAVQLYHDNAQKFTTTSTGVTISGTAVTDLLKVNSQLYFGSSSMGRIEQSGSNWIFQTYASGAYGERFRITDTGVTVSGSISGTSLSIDSLSMNGTSIGSSGNLTLDVAGDIILDADGRDVFFADGGTNYFQVYNDVSNNAILNSVIQDKDIKFTGNDGGSTITALTLDMSAAGNAIFNSHVDLYDSKYLRLGNDADFIIYHDGATNYVQAVKQDSDIIFRGNDGGTNFNALTLDMSAAGAATFNSTISSGDITISGQASGVEGGQINLLGVGSIEDIHVDNYNGTFRVFDGSAPQVRMSLNSAGNATFAGTISSGAIASSGNIVNDIGNSGDDSFIELKNTGYTGNVTSLRQNADSIRAELNSTERSIFVQAGSSSGANSAEIRLYTNTGLSLKVDASQNIQIPNGSLAIGMTSAATSLLDVRGSGNVDVMSKIINTGQTSNGRKTEFLFGKDNGANLSGTLRYVYNSTQASRRIDLFHYGTSNGLSILDGGNVGIGTTSPTARLDVRSANGGVHSRGQLYLTNTDSHAINQGSQISLGGTYAGTSDTYFGSIAARKENATSGNYAGYLQFGTRGDGTVNAERMRITSTGNVGIGTTDPAKKLHVDGVIGSQNSVQGTGFLELQGYGNTAFINMSGSSSLYFRMGSSYQTRMTLLNGGNLGIGTTSPNSVLQLLGPGSSGSTKTTIGFGTSGWGGPLAPNAALDGGVKLALFEGGTQKVQIGMDPQARMWLSSCGSGANGVDIYTGSSNTNAPSLRFRVDQAGLTNLYAGLSVTGGAASDTLVTGGGSIDTSASMGGQSPKLTVNGYSSLQGLRISGADTGNTIYKTGGALSISLGDSNVINLKNSSGTARLVGGGHWEVLGGKQLRAYRSGDSAYGSLYMDTGENLYIYNSWGGKSVVLDRDGNFGIGTNNPAVPLHVASTSQARIALDTTAGSTRRFDIIGDANGLAFRDQSAAVTRMTIDTTGNLLVGTTNTTWQSSAGFRYFAGNSLIVTRSANEVMSLNRLSTDGDILLARKDGTAVATVGVAAGDNIYFAGKSGNTKGIYINDASVYPANQDGGVIDNAVDLGASGYRWKSLFLSNGIYVGGTSSANLLDDYEEGTFTPVLTREGASSNATITLETAKYVKIGGVVTVTFYISAISNFPTDGTLAKITGFPFTGNSWQSGTIAYGTSTNTSETNWALNGNTGYFLNSNGNGFRGGTVDLNRGMFSMTYTTNQ